MFEQAEGALAGVEFNKGALLAAVLTGAASLMVFPAAAQQAPDKKDTAPQAAVPPARADVPQSGAKAEEITRNLKKIRLPEGFRISLFAIVPEARAIAVGPQGKVIFVSTRSASVYALEATLDGEHGVRPFAASTPMKIAHGVCFAKDGTLFIAEQNRIRSYANAEGAYRDPDAAGKTIVEQGKLIPPEHEADNHSRRVCRIGPDNKLYITLGQPFNVPPTDKWALYKPIGIGGIIRMNRNGSGREVFATGIRNSVGMDFNPKDNTLWFTDNQVDRMGDDIPPGELNRAAKAGLNFGFPWYGGGHIRTTEYKDETPPKNLVFPEVEMAAHAADLGMTFYRGSQFPKRYRGGIFSAQHGSWNRTTPIGARVMFTSLKKNGQADKTEPFAEGWKEDDGAYWGRPADVAELPDGSLLVSDDYNGALFRISYEGN